MNKSTISTLVALLAIGCGGENFSSSAFTDLPDSGKDPVSTGGSSDGDSGAGSAGSQSTGGSGSAGSAAGGAKATGGTSSGGGDTGTGGSGSGGSALTGGSTGSGGATSTGGSTSTGGAQSTGGVANSGGTTSTGGTQGTGGSQCVPQPCANDGHTCGQVDDGCGHKAQCLHQCDASKDQACDASSNQCVLSCKTYSDAEKQSICAGKCGTVKGSDPLCPVSFTCDSSNGGTTCSGSYSYCAATPVTTGSVTIAVGICNGIQPDPSGSECPLGSDHPFAYVGAASQTFNDGIKDDLESDVDCGGSHNPARCATGKACVARCVLNDPGSPSFDNTKPVCRQTDVGTDCASQACVSGTCAASSFRTKGCQWPPGATPSDFNGSYCCTDNVNACYRDQSLDSACAAKMQGSWGFDCSYTGPRPPSSACTPAGVVLPGVTPTQYCCHDWF